MTRDFEAQFADVAAELVRQEDKKHGGDTEEFDKGNTRNDWIAFLSAYSGRGAAKVFRNERQDEGFRENMVKVAALALSAIRAVDKGYC